jgi:hypothetical protein
LAALGDIVVLKNGKEIKVEKAWQEGGQVWIIYHGMKASIPPSKVKRLSSETKYFGKHTTETAPKAKQPAQKASPPLVLRKDGFGELRWGMEVTGIGGLEKKYIDSGLKDVIEYIRPNDRLKLGEASLKSVVYAFWRDQLYTVTVWTQGQEDYRALRQVVFNQFGRGTRPDRSIERYLWSDGPADAMLKYTNENQYGMLWMRCRKLDRKLKLAKLGAHTSYLNLMKSKN